MVTNENAVRITSEEAKALKRADSVVFHYQNGEHFIRAIKKDRDVFGTIDREVRVNVQGRIETYGTRKHNLGEVEECAKVISHVNFEDHIQTIFKSLRKEDIIYLRWVANNNHQYLDNAGLFQDQLYLQVHRGGMNKNKKEYLVATSVTPNNSAKMCKHTSTPYLRG